MKRFSYSAITPQQAADMLRSADPPRPADVREPSERSSGQIPGSLSLPLSDIGALAPGLLPDKGAPVLVYCQSGARSHQAAQKLCDMGYSRVYDLEGGYTGWRLCMAGLTCSRGR